MKQNIFGVSIDEVYELLKILEIEKYRVKQIFEWIYKRNIVDFKHMVNLPLKVRERLGEKFIIDSVNLVDKQVSQDENTIKFLLSYHDGVAIETVLMKHNYGNSVCVSTQVGCNMGCKFCASTLHGMIRNLTAAEILSQVFFVNKFLNKVGQHVDSIVIMGSGEPLNNYDNVLKFIKLCHDKEIFNLSYRNITLSTSGIVPNIYKLAEERIPFTLSISLHAASNNIRTTLMPINEKYNIEQVILAASNYAEKTGRRITYEYILINDLNDSIEDAKKLVCLLKGKLANVNLIPVNPVRERGWFRPPQRKISSFMNFLLKNHISVTLRKEMGVDIQAACGQLRNKYMNKS